MIKTPLGFFQVQVEFFLSYSPHFYHSAFRNSPEVLNSVNMSPSIRKNVLAMSDSVMLFIASVYKSIISLPLITVTVTNSLANQNKTDGKHELCFPK